MKISSFIVPLHKVGLEDVDSVGGKNASPREIIQLPAHLGIKIPGASATVLMTIHQPKLFLLTTSDVQCDTADPV